MYICKFILIYLFACLILQQKSFANTFASSVTNMFTDTFTNILRATAPRLHDGGDGNLLQHVSMFSYLKGVYKGVGANEFAKGVRKGIREAVAASSRLSLFRCVGVTGATRR